ncbi:glycine-rich protein A3-like [Papaver somniferum]|uniref:glycine-rich protein A3-like n=1 Tax=Papaver somniferum TaxID=3469 RepID=UPI000E6F57AF|nr:glycine-rich protein A3-like [Papaver somniferum]
MGGGKNQHDSSDKTHGSAGAAHGGHSNYPPGHHPLQQGEYCTRWLPLNKGTRLLDTCPNKDTHHKDTHNKYIPTCWISVPYHGDHGHGDSGGMGVMRGILAGGAAAVAAAYGAHQLS